MILKYIFSLKSVFEKKKMVLGKFYKTLLKI